MAGIGDGALPSRVAALVESLQPRSLLVIAPAGTASGTDPAAVVVTGAEARAHLRRSPRYDLALVDSAAGIPTPDVAPVLAGLRDLKAAGVLVLVRGDAGPAWCRRTLVGLGFSADPAEPDRNGGTRLYRFDIATYKVTPDWLNPRHWAHPELWGRYRW